MSPVLFSLSFSPPPFFPSEPLLHSQTRHIYTSSSAVQAQPCTAAATAATAGGLNVPLKGTSTAVCLGSRERNSFTFHRAHVFQPVRRVERICWNVGGFEILTFRFSKPQGCRRFQVTVLMIIWKLIRYARLRAWAMNSYLTLTKFISIQTVIFIFQKKKKKKKEAKLKSKNTLTHTQMPLKQCWQMIHGVLIWP